MDTFLASLTAMEWIYFICAVAGGTLFLIRMILMIVAGVGDDVDLHVDHADGMDMDGHDMGHDVDHADAGDAGVKLLSFQGIMAFSTMFGLVGMGCTRQGNFGLIISLTMATAVGVATAWVVAMILRFMVKMQSSGTLDIYNALGQEGTVYLTIPKDEVGKVRVTVQDRLRVLDAVAEDKEEIKTGERVRVLGLSGTSVLVVDRI